MKLELTQDMETLIRMIEAQRRTIAQAKGRGESRAVIRSAEFVLREIQAELSDLIAENYLEQLDQVKNCNR